MIPRRDVILKVGFRLRYKGIQRTPVTDPFHEWKHPGGLEVHATEDADGLHVSVSHRERDPSEDEISLVQEAFFGNLDVERYTADRTPGLDFAFKLATAVLGAPLEPHRFKVWHLRELKRAN